MDRRDRQKRPCLDCGNLCHRVSTRCQACATKLRRGDGWEANRSKLPGAPREGSGGAFRRPDLSALGAYAGHLTTVLESLQDAFERYHVEGASA